MEFFEAFILIGFVDNIFHSFFQFTALYLINTIFSIQYFQGKLFIILNLLTDFFIFLPNQRLFSTILFFNLSHKLIFLGNLEANLLAAIIGNIALNMNQIPEVLNYPILCIYILIRVLSLDSHFNLNLKQIIMIILLLQTSALPFFPLFFDLIFKNIFFMIY